MTPFPRLGLGCGVASSAPTDGRRKREQIEIDRDQVYGHQFPREFSAFPFPTSLQQAGTGLGTRGLADRSISTSNFPLPLPEISTTRGNGKWEVCGPTTLGPLGHFLCSAPAEHFLALPSSQPPIPSAGAHRGGQDRPIWAAVGLVLRAPSTAACSTGMGEDTSSKCRPSNAVEAAPSNCAILLTATRRSCTARSRSSRGRHHKTVWGEDRVPPASASARTGGSRSPCAAS